MVDLVTTWILSPKSTWFRERRGYGAPARGQEAEPPKKAAPRAPQGRSSPQRGSGSTQSQSKRTTTRTTRTTDTPEKISDIPSVKGGWPPSKPQPRA